MKRLAVFLFTAAAAAGTNLRVKLPALNRHSLLLNRRPPSDKI